MESPRQKTESTGHVARFVKYHLPVIIYACLILVVSSIPNLKTPLVRIPWGDKIVHFLEYGGLALLTFRSVSHWTANISFKSTLAISYCLLLVFPALDEFFQSLIPGRSPEKYDYIADICGGILFASVYAGLAHKRWYYRTKGQEKK